MASKRTTPGSKTARARRSAAPAAATAASALSSAQDLVYRAYQADTPEQQVALAMQAVETSPYCADAFALLARYAEPGSDTEISLWSRAVEAGEAAIGPEGFAEYAGGFWGFIETRPYMRARLGLALALWRRGEREAAAGHLREMLTLNPGDNQGLRYTLASWLLQLGRDEELAALLKAYEDDGAAAWAWTAALAAFRRDGDCEASRGLLAEAMATNPHVAAYLLGARKLPKRPPDLISLGGADEAVDYVMEDAPVWAEQPGAIEWLRERTVGMLPKRRGPRGGAKGPPASRK